jgi:hypothetical protein
MLFEELPPWALARVLSQTPLSFADLARMACVSKRLCAAARNSELPQWRNVRVVGTMPYINADTFKVGGFGACMPRLAASC